MDDPQNNPNPEETRQQSNEAWQEVGRQFQLLGESLSVAVRTAWEDEANRKRIQEMRTGLESMVNQVGQVIRETANSPEGENIRGQAKKAAENLRSASEQTVTEVRPHLVSALRQLNNELDRLIIRMGDEERNTPNSSNVPPRDGPQNQA